MEDIIFNSIKFKQIKDFPNYYVSKCGKVYSSKRKIILKGGIDKDGYPQVSVRHKNNQKCKKIHRLLALTWLYNFENKPCINHKDGNKINNNINNLEWCTISENTQHAYDHLGFISGMKGKFGKLNKCSKPVVQYNLKGEFIKTWDSIASVNSFYKKQISISAVCKGKRKSANNYKWKYL